MGDRTFYPAGSNTVYERDINFKIFVDGSNAPTLAASPLNNYISSVSRVSQGIYRITLADNYKTHQSTTVDLNVNGAAAAWAQPGPIANFGNTTGALPTVDLLVLNNSSAVTDPPAQASNNVFLSGTISVSDAGGQ